MKVLLRIILLLMTGSWANSQEKIPKHENNTPETRVQNWLREKRTDFYSGRKKDPAIQAILQLYDKMEKDGIICVPKFNMLKISVLRTNEETVQVNWQAATNTLIEGYIIERSFTKDGAYERIHYTRPNGQDSVHTFQFIDNNSNPEKSFYRVIQVNALGEKLDKKAVAEGYDTDLFIRAYPNPSNRHFTLAVQSRVDEPVQVRVVDAMGRIVEQTNKLPPNQLIDIGSRYRSGTFYVQVLQGKKSKQIMIEKRATQTR